MININLLPPELKLKRIQAKRNASLISICVVVVLAVAVLGIISRSLESTVKTNLKGSKDKINLESANLDQYQDLQDLAIFINDRAQAADKIEKDHVYWSEVMLELTNSVPTDVQLKTLSANSTKSPNFVLTGNTTDEREIIKFKDKLEASSLFKSVNFKSSNLSTDTALNKQQVDFSLEFELEQKKNEE